MKASCTCHSAPDLCAAGVIERPCYYPGQLLTPAEMTLEQQYFRDKLRRHNRLMHGWGVVCGAAVCRVAEDQTARETSQAAFHTGAQPAAGGAATSTFKPWKVRVTPGYILGPYGDEILMDREQIVDLRTCGQTGASGEHGEPPDPWCADVYVQREPGPLYIAVRYREMKSRPVRVQPAGCGCDDTQCEYSRCRDGYEVCVVTDCPTSHVESARLRGSLQRADPGLSGVPDRSVGGARARGHRRRRDDHRDRQLFLPQAGGLVRSFLVALYGRRVRRSERGRRRRPQGRSGP